MNNKNKSGIYCWYNTVTGKIYIGSSIKLNKRFSRYFSEKYIQGEILRYRSHIYKSLLKHGYNKFNLYILQYCDIIYKLNSIRQAYKFLNITKPTLKYSNLNKLWKNKFLFKILHPKL